MRVIWLAISIPIFGCVVWSVVDASRRPPQSFAGTWMVKRNWIVSMIGSAVLCGPIGGCFSLYYLLYIRKGLD